MTSQGGKTFGPYLIQDEIARGGQGAVYRALHEPSGKPVALKLLLDNHPKHTKRFAQEAKVLERLSHPHLLRVTDSGEQAGMSYMAMELVEGTNLRDLVHEGGVPDFDWSCRVLAEVASALEYCHAQGLVHRDLKPENVMIETASERAVLVDFGLVKRDAEQMKLSSMDGGFTLLTKTGELRGTPAFMAPEQAGSKRFGEITPMTDVYGLGGVLFHLLTGETPFTGSSLITLIAQIVGDPPPDPRAVNPRVPQHLAALCKRALAKRPADRPQSAAAFRNALVQPAASSRGGARGLLLLTSLALNAVLAVAVIVALSTRPASVPALTWDEAMRRVRLGDAPNDEALAKLTAPDAPALAPLLRAQARVLRGDDPARALASLPPSPERDLLEASALVAAGRDLERALRLLEGARGASVPWIDGGAEACWARLASRLVLNDERLLAARACVRVAASLGEHDPDALLWVDRAFELDAHEAAVADVRFGDWYLRWCSGVVEGAEGVAEDVPRLRLARTRLFQYRLIDPEAELPPRLVDALLRLATSPHPSIREAILPGCQGWRARWSRLVSMLKTRLSPSERQRPNMTVKTKQANVGSPDWRAWIGRAHAQNPHLWRSMLEEWILFRPEFGLLWAELGELEGKRLGKWALAYRLYECGARVELVERHWIQCRVGFALMNTGRFAEAVQAFERALEIDSDVRNSDVQWRAAWHAQALSGAGLHQEALDCLDTLRSQWYGTQPRFWRERASYLMVLGRADEAAEAQEKYERLVAAIDGR